MDSRHGQPRPLSQLSTLSLDETRDDEDVSPSDPSPSASHPTFAAPPVLAQAQDVETQRGPRNRSPYSRNHLHSHSAANNLAAPPMTRTKSLPIVMGVRSYSPSPSHSPVRQASPSRSPAMSSARIAPRKSFDETYAQPAPIPSFMEIETIGEDAELDITPRPTNSDRDVNSSPLFPGSFQSSWHTFPRSNSLSRRRPASPLHQIYQAPVTSAVYSASPSTTPSTTPPPNQYTTAKYTESYPFSATSSMPSTPTSLRSRSPSISSLDTIPDSPEAEQAAIEAFNIAKLKAAADAADAADAAEREGGRRRGSGGNSDGNAGGLRSSGWGAGGLNRDKRKRWSVCGAERRGDFEMETIPED